LIFGFFRHGVRSRSLYEVGFLDDPGFRAEVAEREGRGEEIRFVERVPVGLCAVDRRTSLLSLNPTAVAGGPGPGYPPTTPCSTGARCCSNWRRPDAGTAAPSPSRC
jgi:hypothetical protein